MRFISTALAVCAVLTCTSLGRAQPMDPTQAAIFAGGNITFQGHNTVTGGPVVANGNVSHLANTLTVPSIYAGGSFSTAPAAYQNSQGDLLFNGDIVNLGGPGSVFGGSVTSGGSITLLDSSETIQGNVLAAHNVSQPFGFAVIGGSVAAGGDVNIQGTVNGNVTYGGSFTKGTFATIKGLIAAGGPVTPPAYVPLTLPAGRNLTPGGTDVTLANYENRTLTPGTYGTLRYATSNTVTLTAGHYVFAGITSSFSLNQLSFDTSNGPIDLYVAGDLDFDLVQVINGQPLFVGGNPNPLDSQYISLEVGGSYIGDSPIYGTIFAPNGDITLNFTDSVTGHVLAGRNVTLNADVTVVPEPGSLGLLGVLSLGLLRRRR